MKIEIIKCLQDNYAYIVIEGKTYEGSQTIYEQVYVPRIIGYSSTDSKINYSRNWFAEIDSIRYVKQGSTGGAKFLTIRS